MCVCVCALWECVCVCLVTYKGSSVKQDVSLAHPAAHIQRHSKLTYTHLHTHTHTCTLR